METPLVLLPHAGGTAQIFAGLMAELPPSVRPVPLDLPGRGRRWRERRITGFGAAVRDLRGQVADLEGPIAIFGHSLGAHLGLVLASQLERAGGPYCTTFFASANADPLTAVLPFDRWPLRYSDAEIVEVARIAGGALPPCVLANPALLHRSAEVLRGDFCLSATFTPLQRRSVIDADIVACCGADDIFTDAQIDNWRWHSTGETEVVRFPGGHFYLETQARALARLITSRLVPPARAAHPLERTDGGRA
ncbi:thioesterase II family protein [Actinocorallia sp. A-T 12471]|uniref:thioesterase II family protein n=1 Tax=Actinocorallia sp. A-T 12471 TaxID=3089813 RepID=UPI0029D07EB2|nr:alpha/beta fold hydrolase [Actinocorallia sp. A-T 12471]MDX6741528.1 alpha/beta fold hydrolase [Actinocorallia sp. A-T 12471]